MIDLNGEFTVEMWVKFGKGVQYFSGDDTWPGVNAAVDQAYGWVLRIHPDQRLNFTAGATVDDRPGIEWADEHGAVIVLDDHWHHLAVSSGREGINVFLDGTLYLHMMKTANTKFKNSPVNICLGPTNNDFGRHVDCRFKAFRVSGKQLYSQTFTPPVELTKTDDTLLLLDFSAGKGDKLPDLSGHGHHGTILGGKWSASEPGDGNPGVQPGPTGAPPNRVPPSLLLAGQNRVELENTAGMLDLNGTFTVEMWVNVAKGIQNFVGDETWPAVNNAVERPHGWVLRIQEDQHLNFVAGAEITDRPGLQWAHERGKEVVVFDDAWHHLAVSSGRERIDVFLDGKPYLYQTKSNKSYKNSPLNLFLGPVNNDGPGRDVNCRFRAFRVSGKQLYSQAFTPPAEFTKTEDTLLLLDFSVGKGDRLPDLSGHGHHGKILGGSWSSETAK
jgi:hypothetical protein